MRIGSDYSERFEQPAKRIVLICGCGERLILLGLEADWVSERTGFACECGKELTLTDHATGSEPPAAGY